MYKRNPMAPQPAPGATMNPMYEDAHKRLFVKPSKCCPLSKISPELVNYKNVALLSKFISERGRILPARITNLSCSSQALIRGQIKIARMLALLPFVRY